MHYTYDDDGQLIGTSYGTNFANPPASNTSQTYDSNGNRTAPRPGTGARRVRQTAC